MKDRVFSVTKSEWAKMKFVILSVGLLWWSASASANPTPQGFQFQPFTPVGQWFQNSLQNTLHAVQNIIPFRPGSQVNSPNQIPPNQVQYPSNQVPQNQFPSNQFAPNQVPHNQFPGASYPVEPYPYQQIGQPPQIQVISSSPNGPWIPPRQLGNSELYWPNWFQFPLIPQYTQGEPTIIIISRPSKSPETHHETSTDETATSINSSLAESNSTSSNATTSTASYTTSTGVMGFSESTTLPSTFVPTSGDRLLIY